MKVQIVVTHLLGTGHLARARTLGRAFQDAGHQVQIVSGGMKAPQLAMDDLALVQLPPLRSDGVNFSRLLTQTNDVADDTYLTARRDALVRAFTEFKPDVLITELYPFGRRSLRHEFGTLLETAKAAAKPPLILASIRDILAPPSKPKKSEHAEAMIDAFYDGVLVHSLEATTPLSISWPVSEQLAAKLHYTGYVAAPAPTPIPAGTGEILVSAGGGAVGDDLFRTACEAAKHTPDLTWRLLVGGTPDRITALKSLNSPAIIEPARPDFRQMLAGAAASISMCGYNTALDVLQTGVPAVFVPFDAGNEVEQGLRAAALSQLNAISVVKNSNLTAESLLNAVTQIRSAPKRAAMNEGFNGAEEAVRITCALLKDSQHAH
ncbi:glycosyltransferase [Epibacterium sp. SM1969]|uniref:Glycosyltransferase n=1 Tax=Tritonibacter aquimaris TaxID=2663379 RepID=A0A844AWI3_9RHOB|nr:glycosyltransferase [Tritonibacter aquimaris]MQY42282.1 glycosyltransferase [Tritonibacter aquimaris]